MPDTKEEKSRTVPSREGKRAFTVYMTPELHRKLKVWAAALDYPMQDLVLGSIFEFLDRAEAPEGVPGKVLSGEHIPRKPGFGGPE